MTEPEQTAIEHILWAASHDHSPSQVLESVGIQWPGRLDPRWEDVQLALTIIARRLAEDSSERVYSARQFQLGLVKGEAA